MSANLPRTVLGPLTTTFTPSPACAIGVAQCSTCSQGWQAQTCYSSSGNNYGVEDNPNCWPPRSGAATTGSSTAPLAGWGFYSPGLICPSGFTSACSATGGGILDWPVQFSLLASETAVGCCPTGFKCLNNGIAQTCVLYASSTSFPIVTCQSGTSAAFSYYTLPTTVSATITSASKVSVTAATITAFNMYAPMIQINWQSSDRPTTSTSTSGTSAASSTTSQTSIAQASSKLSTGAEAGIGVGVALGVIAIGIISWVLYRRRRKQEYVAAAGHSPTVEIGGNGIYEMGKRGRNDPIELPDNTSHNGGRGGLSELGT